MTDSFPSLHKGVTGAASAGPAGTDPLLARLRAATLGEYDVYGELGRGGMATVYLAHELALDRKVAIKVMSPALTYGPGMIERFKREARTAAQLSHPNIIPVFAVREVDELLFFVMKLVEGTPLDSIMKELGKLPIPMIEAILAQVGGAFGYAHRRGVVHRDIKPSNILIDEEGWVVVTDFGIAKVQEAEALTQTGGAVGTPTYMSPEQCGGNAIDGRSDQYSLGVVAYEMLTGRPPFTGSSMALMYSHFHEPAPPLERERPDCPEPLRHAVTRMLEKDPAARWPSMEEAVASIGARHLAHDDPTRSQLILLARSGTSHKIASQVQTPRSPVPRVRSTAERTQVAKRRRTGLLIVGSALALLAAVLLVKPRGAPPPSLLTDSSRLLGTTPPAPPAAAPAPAPQPPPPPPPPATSTQRSPRSVATRPAQTSPVGQDRPPPPEPRSQGIVAADTTTRVNPAPAPPPAPAPQPAAAPRLEPTPPLVSGLPAPRDDRLEITNVILAYARALEAGDLQQALRLYPGMLPEQRQGLEAFWRAGGKLSTRWTVGDVSITDNAATARVQGSNTVTTSQAGSSEQRVSLRARLERRGTEWRLVALVN